MQIRFLDSIAHVAAAQWNAVVGDEPFLRHEFLRALEESGCTTTATGWHPQHLAAFDHGELVAAVPLFLKQHSFGEFVFDWGWAEAAQRAGLRYYPKLISTTPLSPVTGPRLFLRADSERARATLAEAVRERAQALGASSVHWLFPHAAHAEWLAAQGYLLRTGYQFHWHNAGYRDFDDFLAGFSADKRKKVKRERRAVAEVGITLETLTGTALAAVDWEEIYGFYRHTIDKHGSHAYLNADFFARYAALAPEAIVLVRARRGATMVGAAFNLRSASALYGRYWGGHEGFPGLHFEACYYTPIEYGIAQRLQRFEGGAHGEHKIARGFVPAMTYSAHWLQDAALGRAVAAFLERERFGVQCAMEELSGHAPYKRG